MLHPVGSRPPAVYWRRRFLLLAAVVVLVVITAWVLKPGSGKSQAQAPHPSPSASSPLPAPADRVATSPAATSTTAAHTVTKSSSAAKSAAKTPAKASSSPAAPPKACVATQLRVAAVAAQSSYSVGAEPVLMLQVTNSGTAPCIQNLADSQVELRVYNGESRVWGSHDCEIQPGADNRTLAVGQPVRVSVTWSGLTSEPACAGTRQRVGAGTYTLYAYLAGHVGTAAQFAIS